MVVLWICKCSRPAYPLSLLLLRDSRLHFCFPGSPSKNQLWLFISGRGDDWSTIIIIIIVSIKKFLIVIGSLCTYLSRNWCVIMWVSNYRYPIWMFCYWIPIIGYPRDLCVNYACFNGFLSNVSYSFQNLWKALQTFFLKRTSQMTCLIPKFVINAIN